MTTAPDVTEAPEAPEAPETVQDSGYGREFADFYDRLFPRDTQADLAVRRLAEWHPGGRALELGVGTGRIAVPLAERTGDIVGVDSSPEMLDRLRAAIATTAAPVTPMHGDIRAWADGATYGLVYCVCATLSMLLDPADQRAAIAVAARQLAPGGTLVVETHNPAFVHGLHEGRARATWFAPYPEPGTGLQTYSTLLPGGGLWHASHLWHEAGTVRVGSELSRLTTPGEVDAYAAAAGLVPVSRHADWAGTAFADDSPLYVSRYTRPTEDGPHDHR
ncbi:class I SAM-dependent methyltransferase [Streptomyces radicis]|uniref:Class I SAM-dependent methyltransferase n=1 Tax=Streptomyces radicis TaxID=1750517 RepID=A0A3A9WDS4_9ACTN|nr:class I SAM-dependent methyltransferase [Streptomyces radicis]RKN10929.1 class I SAM-dependent methyltransferase [Streptomyces radicis]RKN25192.1 class I SAM-dependent methyltransferase [Streptomyces radicis]